MNEAHHPIWRVSEITRHIKGLLEADPCLWDLWLEGEVSNFRQASSGHAYFTLQEGDCKIACVMWRESALRQPVLPQDGEAVLAHGSVSVYEVRGAYQFYVDQIQPAGLGLRYLELQELKERLEAEGLFAPERKRSLPALPSRIGVVTSGEGAAFQDILHVLGRRFPLAHVVLASTLVQGDEAPAQIAAALEDLNARGDVEVIILTRGGGALEELWAFNAEVVVRAIAASRVPVVCGVGHETDFTLADFAADVRAPTPSAAAEIVAPDASEIREQLADWRRISTQVLSRSLKEARTELNHLTLTLVRESPLSKINEYRQRVDELEQESGRLSRHRLDMCWERWRGKAAHLRSLSPSSILDRGYAIARRLPSGDVIRKVAQVSREDSMEIQVSDGRFRGIVTDTGGTK
jgi:exodeoxyribonuclease VII large subunit